MKHYKPVFIKFSMSSPLAQTQSPLLKTFWRRFRLRILYTKPMVQRRFDYMARHGR